MLKIMNRNRKRWEDRAQLKSVEKLNTIIRPDQMLPDLLSPAFVPCSGADNYFGSSYTNTTKVHHPETSVARHCTTVFNGSWYILCGSIAAPPF